MKLNARGQDKCCQISLISTPTVGKQFDVPFAMAFGMNLMQ